jgi:hypothetical protein
LSVSGAGELSTAIGVTAPGFGLGRGSLGLPLQLSPAI